jgi:hypothetical protein
VASGGAPAAAVGTGPTRFPIRIDRRSWPILVPWGVWSQRRAEVAFEGDEVVIRFGWFGARIAVADIERWDRDGPYKWIRAIAVRHTLFKSDVSYLGSDQPAVRLWLRSQRRIYWVTHADLVYVGVEDLEGFGAELTRRGIPGPTAPGAA